MRNVVVTAFVTIALGTLSVAEAQEESREFVFEDDAIDGAFLSPTVENIASVSRAARASLVRLRADFVSEMLASVEDL
ncbi:MAG TPA: hypothetical protein VK116_15975 [Planctomycetota bacterium]|nr:hypothetical protein [Planctomycetota bacterium]